MACVLLFNKPYNVLSQFTDDRGRQNLSDFIPMKNVYAAGRLDYDSEGLLLLTDSGQLQQQISHPKYKQPKTYLAQVEGIPDREALLQLANGVQLKDGVTRPAKVKLIATPQVWERNPPIRERQRIPTRWLSITITEGRNRQVRRMTAAVGLPTLRLIRTQIGRWSCQDIKPGEYRLEQFHLPVKSQ